MKTRTRSVHQIVEDQVSKWQYLQKEAPKAKEAVSVITVSREPGSGGRLVAEGVAQELDYDLFHQEVVHEMAQSAQVSGQLLDTLDEKGLNILEDWIAAAVADRHLWPDQYLQHLMKVIGTISKHGRAVIIGRGANFILPPKKRFRVRIVAPRNIRIQNVASHFGVSQEEARRRVTRTDSDRKAFIRKYFYTDIADPLNYDLVINTGEIPLDGAVKSVVGMVTS
jgi:cytidylate kinase